MYHDKDIPVVNINKKAHRQALRRRADNEEVFALGFPAPYLLGYALARYDEASRYPMWTPDKVYKGSAKNIERVLRDFRLAAWDSIGGSVFPVFVPYWAYWDIASKTKNRSVKRDFAAMGQSDGSRLNASRTLCLEIEKAASKIKTILDQIGVNGEWQEEILNEILLVQWSAAEWASMKFDYKEGDEQHANTGY